MQVVCIENICVFDLELEALLKFKALNVSDAIKSHLLPDTIVSHRKNIPLRP